MSNHISYTGNERLFAEQLFESRWYDNWPESYIKEYFDECKEDEETPIVDKNTARNLANILKNNNFNLTQLLRFILVFLANQRFVFLICFTVFYKF